MRFLFLATAGLTVACLCVVSAEDEVRKELDQLRRDLDQLRKEKAADRAEIEALRKERSAAKTPIAAAEAMVASRYGPDAAVTTKTGKLTVGGLLQVWFYSIQNDNIGFFGDRPGQAGGNAPNSFGDTNEMRDNDSFAIRRAQLRFTMDITEDVSAVLMIDPARDELGRPQFPTNTGLFKTQAEEGFSVQANALRFGSSSFLVANIIEDAYINYHGVVPHHDFTVGQYRKFLGEEGIRDDAQLDFVERSMLAQTYTERDLGLTVHGTWWDHRFQYWLGVFNDAANWLHDRGTFGRGSQQNRVDDNDQKSLTWRVLVRPLWKHETWGSLELGVSGEHGRHGEAGGEINAFGTGAVDGLGGFGNGIKRVRAHRYYAWASYRPGGPVRGWWLKGEWGWIRDRHSTFTVQVASDINGFVGANQNFGFSQAAPNAFAISGFSFSTGYRISESTFKDSAPGWLKNFEFALRYEQFQNVHVADLVRPMQRTDVFATDVWTAGVNYFIKGDHAKIQLNYIVVDDPDADSTSALGRPVESQPRRFHGVDNDSLILNFQVGW